MQGSQELVIARQKAIWSFLSLFVAWVFFFWPTLVSIFGVKQELWLSVSTYGIVLISLYFVITRINAIQSTTFASSQLGLLSLFLMIIFYILGQINNLEYAKQSSVMLMFPALVMTAFGPMLMQTILFPLLYLMFIIPLQDETLSGRPFIVGVALVVLIAYCLYQKFSKSKVVGEVLSFERPLPTWVSTNARWLLPTFIAFSMMMVSPWLGENIRSFYPAKNKVIALRAPLGVQGWTGPYPVRSQAWSGVYQNASATLEEQYLSGTDSNSVYLYTAYFHSDRDFADMLNQANTLYDTKLWKQLDFGTTEVKLSNGLSLNVFQTTLESEGVFREMWYWYYIAGVSTIDLSLAQFLDKIRIIAKYAQGSGVIAVSTTYTNTPSEAKDRLNAFLSVMYNGLDVLKRPEIAYTRSNPM